MIHPTPSQILAARKAAGLTQTEAAELIHATQSAWIKWERGVRHMHPAMWELFKIKSGIPVK